MLPPRPAFSPIAWPRIDAIGVFVKSGSEPSGLDPVLTELVRNELRDVAFECCDVFAVGDFPPPQGWGQRVQ
jgi:hypothetical protein